MPRINNLGPATPVPAADCAPVPGHAPLHNTAPFAGAVSGVQRFAARTGAGRFASFIKAQGRMAVDNFINPPPPASQMPAAGMQANFPSQFQPQVPPQFQSQVPPQFQPQMPPQFQPQVPPQFQPQVPPQFQPQVPPQFQPQVPPQFQPQVPPQFQPQVPPQFQPQVPPQFQPQVPQVPQFPPTPTHAPPQFRPSRPYTPVRVPRYASNATQKQSSVNSTEYVRQAAELLIAPDGHLDTTHIPQLIEDLKRDTTLCSDHRQHLIKTLNQLQHNGQLAATINSTCEQKRLHGPAADLVRATLNLPPEHAHLAPADARKAVVMTLLGHLRQGQVGSCFATGPAICMHKEPAGVAMQLKELLEENCLTFRQGNTTVQVPLNKRASRANAQVKLAVTADGTCYGKANQPGGQPYKLHQTPGMQGALTALGIPPQRQEQAISVALWQMGVQPGGTAHFSCQQIIEHIARTEPGNTGPLQRSAAALNAFAGKEDVRLLRAWEYTLATHSESKFSHWSRANVAWAVLHGPPVPGAPHLRSLSDVSNSMAQQLRQQPHYRGAPVDTLNQTLMNNVDHLMKTRFFMQYDPDVAQKGVSKDGVTNRGGFVLYDRVPPNDPTKWQPIDNEEKFQKAMASLVEEAAQRTGAQTANLHGHPQVKQHALRTLTDNVKNHIGTPAFTQHASLRFNSLGSNPPSIDPYNQPWKQGRGGWSEDLVAQFGGQSVHQQQFAQPTPAQSSAHPGGPAEPMDSNHILRFLSDGAMKMRQDLHMKAQQTQGDFKVPMRVPHHACSFMPMQMADIWAGNQTPEQWINNKLMQPALQQVNARRTEPALFRTLKELGAKLNMHPNQVDQMYQRIAQRNGGLRNGPQAYTLANVHEEMKAYCGQQAGGDAMLKRAEEMIMKSAPPPATLFADTNWEDDKGNAVYMGASYNPFRNRVESHFMNEHGGNRNPMGEEWLTGQWGLSKPMASVARAA